jgi:hypothetical protein
MDEQDRQDEKREEISCISCLSMFGILTGVQKFSSSHMLPSVVTPNTAR